MRLFTEVKLDIMCWRCTISYIMLAGDIGHNNYAQYLQSGICRLIIKYRKNLLVSKLYTWPKYKFYPILRIDI